jgi:hypothetical protein
MAQHLRLLKSVLGVGPAVYKLSFDVDVAEVEQQVADYQRQEVCHIAVRNPALVACAGIPHASVSDRLTLCSVGVLVWQPQWTQLDCCAAGLLLCCNYRRRFTRPPL